MADFSRRGFCVSRHALGPRHARFVFGLKAHRSSLPGFRFLLGTALRFTRRLLFCRHARQSGGFRNLFGTQLFVRQIGRPSLGFGPLTGQAREFFLFVGPGSRCDRQFGSREFAALGIRQRALFSLDSGPQSDFGHAFDMSLLRSRCLGRRFGGSAADRVLRREIFCLLAPLRRGNVLGRQQLPRLGDGTGVLISAGARQRVSLGGPFGVCRVRSGEIAAGDKFPAMPLCVLQSL
jgi:hypothetical protein